MKAHWCGDCGHHTLVHEGRCMFLIRAGGAWHRCKCETFEAIP